MEVFEKIIGVIFLMMAAMLSLSNQIHIYGIVHIVLSGIKSQHHSNQIMLLRLYIIIYSGIASALWIFGLKWIKK